MKKLIASLALVALFIAMGSTALAVPPNVLYDPTRSFLEILDEEEIYYTYAGVDSDNDEQVTISFPVGDTSVEANVFFEHDLESCMMRVWNFVNYDVEQEQQVIQAVNELNASYRWCRFYCDSTDDSVTVAIDCMFREHDVGEICYEAFAHLYSICDAAYPSLAPYHVN